MSGQRAVVAQFRKIYADGGRSAVLRHALSSVPKDGPAAQLASMHGELDELDIAFHHLDRVIDARDSCLVHLAVVPQWDSLRADARFGGRLGRMGLPAVGKPVL